MMYDLIRIALQGILQHVFVEKQEKYQIFIPKIFAICKGIFVEFMTEFAICVIV